MLLSGYVSACQDLLSRRAADRIHAVTGNCRRKTFLFHRFFFCYYWGIFIKRSFFPSPPVWYLSMTALAGQTLAHPGVGPRVASGLRQLPLQVSPGPAEPPHFSEFLGLFSGKWHFKTTVWVPVDPDAMGSVTVPRALCAHAWTCSPVSLCRNTHMTCVLFIAFFLRYNPHEFTLLFII